MGKIGAGGAFAIVYNYTAELYPTVVRLVSVTEPIRQYSTPDQVWFHATACVLETRHGATQPPTPACSRDSDWAHLYSRRRLIPTFTVKYQCRY